MEHLLNTIDTFDKTLCNEARCALIALFSTIGILAVQSAGKDMHSLKELFRGKKGQYTKH